MAATALPDAQAGAPPGPDDEPWADVPGVRTFDGRPALAISRCVECGTVDFPPLAQCPRCWGDVRVGRAGAVGVVESHARVHRTPPGVPGPYTACYVVLGTGVRVFAPLTGSDEPVRSGAPVTVVVGADDASPFPYHLVLGARETP